MDWRVFFTTFMTLLVAELGDKTQLAAISMTASSRKPLSVFLGGSLALAVVTGLGVLFGGALLELVPEAVIRKIAAAAFVIIGVLMWLEIF